MDAGIWQIRVDTGGTFTDCVAIDPAGELRRAKVLSSSALRTTVRATLGARRLDVEPLALADGALPGWSVRPLGGGGQAVTAVALAGGGARLELAAAVDWPPGQPLELASPEEAPVLAARLVTGTPADGALPPVALRLATTLGTNALLERRGAPVALFVTRGFADLLAIGDQRRPDLFALRIEKPEPLPEAVVEVAERLAADGSVLVPLDLGEVRAAARELRARGITSAAVALLHAFRDDRHERMLAAVLREEGFAHVSTSAALAPVQGYLGRAETAVVDAYLAPIVGRYLERIGAAMPGSSLHVMTSAGGLVAPSAFAAKEGLLSGPAGGVVGAAAAGEASGATRLLTFDMGGTSTDVARYDGDFSYVFEQRVGAARLLAPALAVETVAAGGGSRCWFDGRRVRVGPESGGARPGPACYGAGGPLCLTDVNLLLGRLDPRRFQIPLDVAAAARAFEALRGEVRAATGEDAAAEALLAGFLRIADERMADAIREISVRQGYDPADHSLLAFGGAGPQHACAVAALLGIGRVIVPADAGLLSAVGLGAATIERFAVRQVLLPLTAVAAELRNLGRGARAGGAACRRGRGSPAGRRRGAPPARAAALPRPGERARGRMAFGWGPRRCVRGPLS